MPYRLTIASVMGLLAGLAWSGASPAGPRSPWAAELEQAAREDDSPTELVMAAACLERGEDTAAASHLSKYLDVHPEQAAVRASLAELLWRRDRLPEARVHFEKFLESAQARDLDLQRQIHSHIRLMAIAERTGDRYREHLHRGIGLYLLGRSLLGKNQPGAEAYLCKAAGELTLASRESPEEARPHWYLTRVWENLGQSQAAQTHRAVLERPTGRQGLTAAEKQSLALESALESRPR